MAKERSRSYVEHLLWRYEGYLAYAKRKLNQEYLNDSIKNAILNQMNKIELS